MIGKLLDLKQEKQELETFLTAVLQETAYLSAGNDDWTTKKHSASGENRSAPSADLEPQNNCLSVSPDDLKTTHAQESNLPDIFVKTSQDEEKIPDGRGQIRTAPLKAEGASTKAKPKKKKDRIKTKVYDFAPEKKYHGIGKWIWIFILLLIALFAGYFWIYPENSSKILEIIKSYWIRYF